MNGTALDTVAESPLERATPDQIEDIEASIIRRAEGGKRVVRAAISSTYASDWVDFGGPYLQGKGADRLARFCGLRLGAPEFTERWEEGECFVECVMMISWPRFDVDYAAYGACSTLDKFYVGKAESRATYRQYVELADGNERKAKFMLLPHVKKKAHENAKSRGVSSLLGVRGLTWQDLEGMGFTPDRSAAKVKYASGAKTKKSHQAKDASPATIEQILALPKDSVCTLRATVFNIQRGKMKWMVTVTEGTNKLSVTLWLRDFPEQTPPEGLVAQSEVFFPEIKVGEWQGNAQYSANAVEVVE